MEIEEPMDIDATGDFDKFDDLLEEGEYIESNHISRKTLSSVVSIPGNRFESKSSHFITGIDVHSKEEKRKREERAKRFGLSKETQKHKLKQVQKLYESFGICEDLNIKNYRLDVLHMRGTENMNTKDIFKYFEEFSPVSIEWINDISCNIVFLDKISAARALLGLSKRIVGVKSETTVISSDNDSDEDNDLALNGKRYKDEHIHLKDIRCPLPQGIWRKGRTYMESRNIFLRLATKLDKKVPHVEKPNDDFKIIKSNTGGIKSILTSSRKRTHKELKEASPPIKKEASTNKAGTNKAGTNGIAAKNPWGSLSKNWGVTDFVEDDYLPKTPIEPTSNVKERLGFKTDTSEEVEENVSNVIELSDETGCESSSEEENWCKRSKMPRMRMHADDEEAKIQKRKGKIRDMVNCSSNLTNNDLRGRLIAKRRLPPVYQEAIQVVLTNPKVVQTSNFRNIDVTEDEDEDYDIDNIVHQEDHNDNDDDHVDDEEDEEVEEEEEGEIIDDSEADSIVVYEEEDAEVEESFDSNGNTSDDSSLSEKEIQGPKGSVIKVVQHKPKLASTVSTVWSRLNHSTKDKNGEAKEDRCHSKTDLRHTLRKNDLRSRIGNNHMKGRSPLRIELRNDKYAGRISDSE